MFKIVCRLKEGPAKKILRRFRLYHPPLHRLAELSEGSKESLVTRSKEFSVILSDVLINGVWKRTGTKRMKDLDKWVAPFLQKPIPLSFAMLDVGGSDGSTTFDTVNYFRDNLGVDIRATILEMQLRIYSYRRGCIRYFLTHDKNPLLIHIGPLGILLEEMKAREGKLLNPIARGLKKKMKDSKLEKRMKENDDVLLINPLVRNNPNINWVENDLFIFDPTLIGAFDFIRCCNVLNYGYFSDLQITEAAELLAQYLKPNGILLVSRTIDDAKGKHDAATLWMKYDGTLQHVSDLNGGSEVKSLVPVILLGKNIKNS